MVFLRSVSRLGDKQEQAHTIKYPVYTEILIDAVIEGKITKILTQTCTPANEAWFFETLLPYVSLNFEKKNR